MIKNESLENLDDIKPTIFLDVESLNCPIPLLRTKKHLGKLSTGEILQIDGVKANFFSDIKGWCERNNYLFLGEKKGYIYTSILVKKI